MKLRHVALVTTVAAAASACGGSPDGNAEKVGWTSDPVVVCAGGSTVKGVDVSTYQGSVNWGSVKAAGYDFAFARVSDGTNTVDNTFNANWPGIKAAGMVRGLYQFFEGTESGTAQADLIVNMLNGAGGFHAGDIPPVADVEVLDGASGSQLMSNLAAWVTEIKAKMGVTPIIYTAPGFWNGLPNNTQFGAETLWVANWQVNCPDTPSGWNSWKFWQYDDGSTTANVPGISGAVDKDEFNGTLTQLQQLSGPAPYAAQYVSQSFPLASMALTMTEGQTIPSYIELKNVGSKTWDSNTHLGTTQPRDMVSPFADSTWLADNRPAGVTGTVAPGGTYKFKFDLHAPNKTGTYYQYFGVVEDGVAWFSDPGQGGPPDNDLEVQVKVIAGPADAGTGGTDGGGSGSSSSSGGGSSSGSSSGGTSSGSSSGSSSGGVGTGDDGGVAVGDDGGASGSGDDGGPGSWDSSTGSTGGCSIGTTPGDGAAWALGAGLMLALVSFRRRAR